MRERRVEEVVGRVLTGEDEERVRELGRERSL